MKQLLKSTLRRFGFDLVRHPPSSVGVDWAYPELTAEEKATIAACQPFSLTGFDRMAGLIAAVNFISRHRIPGDIVECGVWRGGSMMVIARTLLRLGDVGRTLYLYDTFEGMPTPAEVDRSFTGRSAQEEMDATPAGEGIWARATIEDVQANLRSTGYPLDKIRYIKGQVEATIPATLPAHISLLRLDTDWYASTKHELVHLFPLLDRQGLLIIDDYGHYQGAKKAVDEYFAGQPIFLHRLDYTARLLARGGA
jgi:O-methyltransferase